jgi:hypothetical protein
MNVSDPFHNSRKIIPFGAPPVESSVDANKFPVQRDFPARALTEMQWARIINASCKAFFIKRGLDPDTEQLASFFGDR